MCDALGGDGGYAIDELDSDEVSMVDDAIEGILWI